MCLCTRAFLPSGSNLFANLFFLLLLLLLLLLECAHPCKNCATSVWVHTCNNDDFWRERERERELAVRAGAKPGQVLMHLLLTFFASFAKWCELKFGRERESERGRSCSLCLSSSAFTASLLASNLTFFSPAYFMMPFCAREYTFHYTRLKEIPPENFNSLIWTEVFAVDVESIIGVLSKGNDRQNK